MAVRGAEGELQELVYKTISLKPQKITTRSELQADIYAIFETGFFSKVEALPEDTPLGVRVTFVVEPNPVLKSVQVSGNRVVPDSVVTASFSPYYGKILNNKEFLEGVKQVQQWYQDNGYTLAQVSETPNVSPDGIVTLEIDEGEIKGIHLQIISTNGIKQIPEGESLQNLLGEPLENFNPNYNLAEHIQLKVGDIFNTRLAERDRSRLKNLGYFSDVNFSTVQFLGQNIVVFYVTPLVAEARQLEKDGNRQAAIAKYEQAASFYAKHGEPAKQAAVLRRIGTIYAAEFEEVIQKEREAEQRLSVLVSKTQHFNDILGLDLLLAVEPATENPSLQAKQEKAISYFKEAAAIFRESGNPFAAAQELYNIGLSYRLLNEPQRAIDSFKAALGVLQSVASPQARWVEVATYQQMGIIYQNIGDDSNAIIYLQKSIFLALNLDENDIPPGKLGFKFGSNGSMPIDEAYLQFDGEDGGLRKELGEPEERKSKNAKQMLKPAISLGILFRSRKIKPFLDEQQRQKAIALLEAETNQAKTATDSLRTGMAFLVIASFYEQLGERQKALTQMAAAAQAIKQVEKPEIATSLLLGLAWLYRDFDEKQQAIPTIAEAYQRIQQVKEPKANVGLLLGLAWFYREFDEKQKALATIAEAYQKIEQVEEPEIVIISLLGSAWLYQKLDQRQSAIAAIDNAYSKAGNLAGASPKDAIFSLLGVSWAYSELAQEQQTVTAMKKAFSLWREQVKEHPTDLDSNVIVTLPDILVSLGKLKLAIAFYEELIPWYRELGQAPGKTAIIISKVADAYAQSGNQQQATTKSAESASLFRLAGDSSGEAQIFIKQSEFQQEWGQYQQAIDSLDRAANVFLAAQKSDEATLVFNSLAKLYYTLGDREKALNSYNRALEQAKQQGNRDLQVILLVNLGQFYRDGRKYQLALDSFQQARQILVDSQQASVLLEELAQLGDALTSGTGLLEFIKEVNSGESEAIVLAKMSLVYLEMGEKEQAISTFKQAVEIANKQNNYDIDRQMFLQGAILYDALGDFEQAIHYLNLTKLQLDSFLNSEKPAEEARILILLGRLSAKANKSPQGREYLQQALQISRKLGRPAIEIEALYAMASLESQQSNLKEALNHMEAAIAVIESLRMNIASSELRTSFFAEKQDYYQFYIDLLMQLHQQNPHQGYDGKALHISERARARSLLELLSEANANIRQGVDPKLLEQERLLQQQLNNFEHRKYELVSSQYTQKELDEIQEKIDTILTQLDQLAAQIRVASPRYADLKYPEPLTLQQIQQQVLDDDTLLLEYALGEEGSYLWAVTKNSITSYALPKRSEIEAATQTFRQSLTPDSAANLETGLPLSQMVLAPVVNQLGNKRLLIVGDGALQSVPFAALPIPSSPTTPLLVQNEIITLPSASTVAIQRRQLQNRSLATKKLAVLADPIFNLNDSRLAGSSLQPTPETPTNSALTTATRNLGLGDTAKVLDRLQYTRTEAEKILALVSENQRLQALDFNASRTTATSPDLAQYQIIHLATHGLLDPVNPELSGIVLSLFDQKGQSQDGFLRLHDIFNLNLPAELVVLSACETGLGKEVKGEGLVGLTRGFMYAGARRVVVSLWSVNDAATSEVMVKFYQKMLEEGQNPVSALRAAQLEMWKSLNWQSPYYWAAFTVQGDWR
ncbi:MAG TPA: hypothetical protein DDZ80_07870 [Cyanobacteria bacterium UBA8803]|nr:hypothetical protein [Cyanobacteria bacterium UBA8803]